MTQAHPSVDRTNPAHSGENCRPNSNLCADVLHQACASNPPHRRGDDLQSETTDKCQPQACIQENGAVRVLASRLRAAIPCKSAGSTMSLLFRDAGLWPAMHVGVRKGNTSEWGGGAQ